VSAEPRAEQRMIADDFERDAPEMGAPRGRILRIDRSEETAQRLFAAVQERSEDDGEEQREGQTEPDRDGAQAGSLFSRVALLSRAELRQRDEEDDLGDEADEPAARIGHDQRDPHQSGSESV